MALAGDFVELRPSGDTFEVDVVTPQVNVRAFDQNQGNSVTASSNTTTSDQNASELEQRDGWLAQYRLTFPRQDFQGLARVLVDLGGAQSPLYTSKNNRGHIEESTGALAGYGALTELYIFEQTEPQFSFDNNTGANITVQDVRFSGFQLKLIEADIPSNVQPVVLPTEAIGSVG